MADGNRYIQAPKPISFGTLSVSIRTLVEHLVSNDRRYNSNGRGIRSGARLLAEFADEEKAFFKLHPDDWKLLHEVSEKPGEECGYPTLIAQLPDGTRTTKHISRELLPFLDAIANATTEPPTSNVDA